jgi:uncharacterized membrane protein (DUF373 family)
LNNLPSSAALLKSWLANAPAPVRCPAPPKATASHRLLTVTDAEPPLAVAELTPFTSAVLAGHPINRVDRSHRMARMLPLKSSARWCAEPESRLNFARSPGTHHFKTNEAIAGVWMSRSEGADQIGERSACPPFPAAGRKNAMLKIADLKKEWDGLTAYGRFEQIASRIVMVLISLVIVYSLVLIAIGLFNQLTLDSTFPDVTALKDVFGSILTVLILIEFNHSIAYAITRRSGVLQARYIVLIAILVIARKVILLDFATATFDKLIGIGAIALAFGGLYWLISARTHDAAEARDDDRTQT